MTPKEARKTIEELTEKIEHYNYLYYQKDVSEISDFEFDQLLDELIRLEEAFPEYKSPHSPTQRVGGTITRDFPTVVHKYPMLSLGNTYSKEELNDFDGRVARGLHGESYDYICELKFDGVALSITYTNGLLTRAVTRGDGSKGDDITNNAKTIPTLPLKIKGDYPLEFEVRGEVFMHRERFMELNQRRIEAGEEPYANARNTTSGTLKMQDSAEVARRKLDCYLYSLITENNEIETHYQGIQKMIEMGFHVSPTFKKCLNINQVFDYIDAWEQKRQELPLETDGVVIKVNNLKQQQKLGFTAKSPRWAIAFKYKTESASTGLKDITYQVGRTGAITPVAELDPVFLAGTTVKRASLHNANEIERLDVRIGDTVFVEKGGEIIPKITGVDLSKRPQAAAKVEYVLLCPECNTKLERPQGEAVHYCPNLQGCPPQITGRIIHFAARNAMDIESLGYKTILLLYEKGLVRSPADLYNLTYDDLVKLEGFQDLSARNVLEGLEASKAQPFENVLFALGIRYVGKTVSEKLANHFGSMEAILEADFDELVNVPEIGDKIAESIIKHFSFPENRDEVARLKQAGIQFEKKTLDLKSNVLEDQSFVVSGVFKTFGREEIKAEIKNHGGKVVSSVSGNTDFLVAGDNMGPAKKEKAEKLGVKIISESEFRSMINQ